MRGSLGGWLRLRSLQKRAPWTKGTLKLPSGASETWRNPQNGLRLPFGFHSFTYPKTESGVSFNTQHPKRPWINPPKAGSKRQHSAPPVAKGAERLLSGPPPQLWQPFGHLTPGLFCVFWLYCFLWLFCVVFCCIGFLVVLWFLVVVVVLVDLCCSSAAKGIANCCGFFPGNCD